MKIKRLDDWRMITSSGYIVQLEQRGSSREAGAVWLPSKNNQGYRLLHVGNKNKKVHRLVWETFKGPIPDGMHVDHINGDRADNRIENLRVATQSENFRGHRGVSSKSGYRGVYPVTRSPSWAAILRVNGKGKYGGVYPTKIEAAIARDKLAIKHGFRAEGLNFPELHPDFAE